MTDTTAPATPGITAVVITPAAVVVRTVLPVGSDRLLRLLYELIGCRTVDVVRLTERVDMWLDDEGLINGSDDNLAATVLARRFGRTQTYAGTVVLTGPPDADGNTTSLNDDFLKQLPDLLGVRR